MAKNTPVPTEEQPAEQETKTRVTVVSVRVKRELDAGYVPFLRYMKKTQYKNPPFGMRDATRATFEVFMSAEVGDDMTAEEVITELSRQGHAIADRELRQEYPEAFPQVPAAGGPVKTVEPEVLEEAFLIASTTVERPQEDF